MPKKRSLHTAFIHGDEVKLKDRFATALMNGSNARTRVNWLERRGVVVRCNESNVTILWSGRRTLDAVPIGGVERVQERLL